MLYKKNRFRRLKNKMEWKIGGDANYYPKLKALSLLNSPRGKYETIAYTIIRTAIFLCTSISQTKQPTKKSIAFLSLLYVVRNKRKGCDKYISINNLYDRH
jgi:hypothetical protein